MDNAVTLNLNEAIRVEPDGIISRTIHKDDRVKAVLFGFATGQELSEHTSSKAAIMHFLSGEAEVKLGDQHQIATSGTWIQMPPGMRHAILAREPTTMLLLLLQ